MVDAAAPLDAYGNGSINWTPNFITNSNVDHGNTALVRVIVNGSSALSQNFLVTNAGNDYYINGNSTAHAEYTTAVGNDLNSGKTPDAPMADLAALLRAYTLAPGDVVYIDTGSYVLLTDLTLGAADSGAGPEEMVTFQGPTDGTATLNRENPEDGNVFLFTGASYVSIDNLTLTGANIGIDVETNAGSNSITASHDVITNSTADGVYFGTGNTGFTLNASQIYGSANGYSTGVYLSGNGSSTASVTDTEIFGQQIGIWDTYEGGTIADDSIHDNSSVGIEVTDEEGPGYPIVNVSNNDVFNNGNATVNNYGIEATGDDVVVSGNNIENQSASGDVGLSLASGAVASNNTISGNYDGIDISSGGAVSGNRIFVNTDAGVVIGSSGGSVLDNRIYSNGIGVLSGATYSYAPFNIQNNLIYDNSSGAIDLSSSSSGVEFEQRDHRQHDLAIGRDLRRPVRIGGQYGSRRQHHLGRQGRNPLALGRQLHRFPGAL